MIFDLLAFFTFVIVVRNLGAAPWVNWLLAATVAAAVAIGHRFRRSIAQELIAPRTRLGVAFAAFGPIGAFAAGMLGYATGRSLPPVVLLGLLFLFAVFVFVVGDSMWVRAENPDWQPEAVSPRRKRGL